jgi:hypothetical protein
MSGECIESGENGWQMSGECIESGQFSKMAILASTRIRQNWRIFGEYSNSTNLPASGHCLVIPTFFLLGHFDTILFFTGDIILI